MGNQAGIIIRNVKNELFHSAKRLILNEVKGIECLLYESCKMNELDFGRYIEDILTRMKDGDKDYLSMLPCYYKAPEIQVE